MIDPVRRVIRAISHRRFRAVGHLLTGTSATVLLSLLAIAFAARALGPTGYGRLALILALGQACERLLSFQSWQPIIRYGATLDPTIDRDRLRALYKFGLLLDFSGGAAAWAVASLLAIASHFVLQVSWPVVGCALLYSLSLLANFNGTSTAVFRLTDHFRTSAHLQVLNAALRLAASFAALHAGGGLLAFTLVWGVTQATGPILNIAISVRLLGGLGIRRLASASLGGIRSHFPGLLGFTWSANASLTIWASAQQLDTLIVGGLVDPASAGMFHIAKRVSRVVQQVGSQVEAVVYPDLSRLWASGQRRAFVALTIQTELILGAFGCCCVLGAFLFAHWAIVLTAGPAFAGAAPMLIVQIMAVSMTISGAGNRAALLSMGHQPAVLRTVLASAATFYLLVVPMISLAGAMGANLAHVGFGLVWLGGLAWHLQRALRTNLARPIDTVVASAC